jgi:hypothetical protein
MNTKTIQNTLKISMIVLMGLFFMPLASKGEEKMLPPETSIEKAIDYYIEASWKEKKLKPAVAADDTVWLRRVSLDLAGRIPTASEAKAFIFLKHASKI